MDLQQRTPLAAYSPVVTQRSTRIKAFPNNSTSLKAKAHCQAAL